MKINLLKYKRSFWDRFDKLYRVETASAETLVKLRKILGMDVFD